MSSALSGPALPVRAASSRSRAFGRFFRHRLALVGSVLLASLGAVSVLGPYAYAYGSEFIDIPRRFAAPFSGPHWLGTDSLGRDTFARLMMAGRVSLLVGFAAMLVSTVVGVAAGAVAGFYGGTAGALVMRVVDAMLCFPPMFLLLAVSAFIDANMIAVTLIIALTSWMNVARLVEAQIRTLRERDFARAAVAIGASDSHIIFRELVPNAVAPIVVTATLYVAKAILLESYISFLGYGIQPPTPTWGNMLKEAQQYLESAPWLAILPGLAITLAVSSCNFIGDGLRDALDPRMDVV